MRKKIEATLYKMDSGVLVDHNMQFVNEGCTYFFNAQHKFIQLSSVERAYFDFMCEKMNTRNKVALNPDFRKQFLVFCNEVVNISKIRTERSLLNIENKLKGLILLFQDPTNKMLHYVNPKHVFKGTPKERAELLKKLAKTAMYHEVIAKALLNDPFDSIKADEEIFKLPLPKDVSMSSEEIININTQK
jgi:hypothetical protein